MRILLVLFIAAASIIGCKKKDETIKEIDPDIMLNIWGTHKVQSNKIENYSNSGTIVSTDNITPTDETITIMTSEYISYSPSGKFTQLKNGFSLLRKDGEHKVYFDGVYTDKSILYNLSGGITTRLTSNTIQIVSTFGNPKKVQTVVLYQ